MAARSFLRAGLIAGGLATAGWSAWSDRSSPKGLLAKSLFGSRQTGLQGRFARDSNLSKLYVWVYKEGLLSAVGHNLLIEAKSWASDVQVHPNGDYEITVTVQADSLEVANQVKYDKDGNPTLASIDGWSKGQIKATMSSPTVLDIKAFPTVVFRGRGRRADAGLVLEGTLTLHGTTMPLTIKGVISEAEDSKVTPHFVLKGETKVKQSNWGITPLSQGFGALRLQDDVKVSWEVHYTQQPI
eukprot:RCo016454